MNEIKSALQVLNYPAFGSSRSFRRGGAVTTRHTGPTCAACGRADKFDFSVSDALWARIVPAHFAGRVVCLGCFDDFAREVGVDYHDAIQRLYFAGDKACFLFSRAWGLPC